MNWSTATIITIATTKTMMSRFWIFTRWNGLRQDAGEEGVAQVEHDLGPRTLTGKVSLFGPRQIRTASEMNSEAPIALIR